MIELEQTQTILQKESTQTPHSEAWGRMDLRHHDDLLMNSCWWWSLLHSVSLTFSFWAEKLKLKLTLVLKRPWFQELQSTPEKQENENIPGEWDVRLFMSFTASHVGAPDSAGGLYMTKTHRAAAVCDGS